MAACFAVSMFCSAFLLFLVQPMFAKLVLPLLGGAPMVWNTCMLFYQAALLGGYLYAHLSITWLGERRQALVHLILMGLSLAFLPAGLATGLVPPAESGLVSWLLGVLFVSVGVPFFFVSCTAPMLQKWFAASGAAGAGDPYFLYATSNLGSMLALLAYPVLIEPLVGLGLQTRLWSLGYVVLLALTALSAAVMWRGAALFPAGAGRPTAMPPAAPLAVSRRLRWLLLSFCPSSLMLGATSYMTTDIAAVPLLWIAPLALYLLSFILVFARKTVLPHAWMLKAQPLAILILLGILQVSLASLWVLPLHLAAFFITAMVCHGELAHDRPNPARLTEYYLIMSVGGVLGGIFNSLVAPNLFSSLAEYPLALVLGCLLRPNLDPRPSSRRSTALDLVLPALLAILCLVAAGLTSSLHGAPWWRLGLVCAALMVLVGWDRRPVRFGLGVGAVFAALALTGLDADVILARSRNFFGTLSVRSETNPETGTFVSLVHGRTIHGVQKADPATACEPLSYYHRRGALDQLVAATAPAGEVFEVGVVGLGVGGVAAYATPKWSLTFYEINPEVERLARDERFFSYLARCAPQTRVVLGDARLTLGRAPDAFFDLIILDAFSSDAIPMHLLTREALALYLRKLKPNGALAFHVSNNYLDLRPVLGNLAADAGLEVLFHDYRADAADKAAKRFSAQWAVFGRDRELLGRLEQKGGWRRLPPDPAMRVWSDDFSNIISVLKGRASGAAPPRPGP